MTNNKNLLLTATILSSLLSASALPAYGQVFKDEIVVTAQKKSENVQSVPISITALSGDQLEALSLDNAVEITQQIPGLQLSAWSPNVTIFNLRGVSQNNFTDNLEAPVAAYTDGVYIASTNAISGQLFDTERVEVLRGPQGTLFGRNATGGLVHYISRTADEDQLNGFAQASYGNFDAIQLEGAVGFGITENLRGRISGQYKKSDGHVIGTAALPGVFESNGQDIGGEDGFGIRGTLQWTPNDNLTADLFVKYSEDNDVPTGGYVFSCNTLANGFCEVNDAGLSSEPGGNIINGITLEEASGFENFSNTVGFFNRDTIAYQANVDYRFDNGLTLTSITNYNEFDKTYLEDGDALPVQIIDFANTVDFRQFSQELRLAGQTERLDWQVGAYYLDFQIDGTITTVGAPIIGQAIGAFGVADSPQANQLYVLDSRNWSIFGQADYALTDKLTLTAGVRLSQDDKDIDYVRTLTDTNQAPVVDAVTSQEAAARFGLEVGANTAVFTDTPGFSNADEVDFGDFAGRLALEYQANDDWLLFASINRGIKGGNWSLAGSIGAENFRHDEETLHSFEVGFKASPFENFRLNATGFYYDYDDYQAFAVTGGTPQITPSDATVFGGEIEAVWTPTPNWDAVLGASFLDSEVDEIAAQGEQFGPPLGAPGQTVQFCTQSGNDFNFCDFPQDTVENAELPNAPTLSLNYLLRYNQDVLAGNVAVQVDGVFNTSQFLEVTNGQGSFQEAYNVTNASLSFAPDNFPFELSVWTKNVFDQEYRQYSLDLGILGTTSFFARPRTYGGKLTFDF